jgi:hypothetical protein
MKRNIITILNLSSIEKVIFTIIMCLICTYDTNPKKQPVIPKYYIPQKGMVMSPHRILFNA